ncbi:unnamed protein product, partial [Gadus morhua 'NCC']
MRLPWQREEEKKKSERFGVLSSFAIPSQTKAGAGSGPVSRDILFSLSLIVNAYKAEEDLDTTREELNPPAGLQHGILRPGSGLKHAALNYTEDSSRDKPAEETLVPGS